MENSPAFIPEDGIGALIFFVKGQRVMLDRDLASLYGIQTKVLLQAVRRNLERFPADFMYRLTDEEVDILRSQSVTSRWGGRRYSFYAFTEQGVAMLSSVLRSRQAIEVNIAIMRAFVKFKGFLLAHTTLAQKLERLERKVKKNSKEIRTIFDAIRQLIEQPKGKIGFHS